MIPNVIPSKGASGTFVAVLSAFADGRLFGSVHHSGAGGIPSILALHGWGRRGADFDATLEGLDAVALDLPGFGATPAPTSAWGAAGYADAIAPILDELATPVVVVGHSFGGRVAVVLATTHPERVAALVLTGVPLVRPPAASPPRKPAAAYRVARALHRRGLFPEPRMEALRQRYGSPDYRAATGVLRGVLVRVVNETYEDELGRLACPVQLVWGDDDAEVPLAVAEAALASLADGLGTLTVVPGAGHFTPRTAPGELRAAVTRCLTP